ncbi:hypothetical protein [Parasitella parasitica]|uniref:Uncharacterized protein n=1 Tax=Parasitella parasitica TaxID=35722 RepID=A0A0B7NG90_9FUNG|nr:hypothetical protein [Parasitella parasitica]
MYLYLHKRDTSFIVWIQLKATQPAIAYHHGTASSRYVSEWVEIGKVVDKPAHMLKLSTVQPRTLERLNKAFDAKLKQGSSGVRSPAFNGSQTAGDKRRTNKTRNAHGAQ